MDQVNWLRPHERRAWLALAGMVLKLPAALDEQLQTDSGLSFIEYMVLAMLGEQENRTLRMTDLAAVTNVSPSRLSHIASRLENQGLLNRSRHEHDARQINATLTDSGWRVLEEAAPGHVTHVRRLVVDVLTETQLGQLSDIGHAVMLEVDPNWAPPSP